MKFYGIDIHQILSITTDNANSMTECLINPAMLCSVYLDPRYCLDLSENETRIAKLTLEIFYEKWMQRSKNIEANGISTSEKEEDDWELFRYEKRMRSELKSSEENHKENIMLLLEQYETNLPHMRHRHSILEYWEGQKDANPILYQLASMVNTIPPTQVTVERAFSILSIVYYAKRTRLAPDLLQHILLIKLNRDLVADINAEDTEKLKAQ